MADDDPKVGDRRATTFFGHAPFGDLEPEPDPDATWTVEEWDGKRWRKVGTARGEIQRDRLLYSRGE